MPRYDNKADSLGHLLDAASGRADGSIERMESQGQRAMAASTDLPKDMGGLTRDEVARETGIQFGEDVNDLFVGVVLPEGWEKRPTEHSMYTDLVDDKGRVRASIFYKTAFYDRCAHMGFSRFYTASTRWVRTTGDGDTGHKGAEVLNGRGEVIKFIAVQDGEASWDTLRRASDWLSEHYPDHESPWAYWSEDAAG